MYTIEEQSVTQSMATVREQLAVLENALYSYRVAYPVSRSSFAGRKEMNHSMKLIEEQITDIKRRF